MSDNNRISLLEKHPNGFSFEIKEVTRGNEYSVIVLEEIGRGGGCIVYRGTVEKDMGLPLFDGPAVIKEFYPKALAEKGLSRSDDGIRLEIPEILTDDFEEQKESFCKGQAKHIYFAGKHADKALSPASYSGKQNGTFYSVSDVSKGEVLSKIGRDSFTIIDALKLVTSICDVIGTLHTDTIPDEEGYESEYKGEYKLYLDCKPSNIFVDSNYNAYLFDFDTVQPLYRYEFCSYSEGWGAPEQKFTSEDEGYKDNMLIGFHTDMFSIGAVLLWLLTGIEGPTKEDLASIEKGFDWKTRITLKDPTGAKDNEEFIEKLDSLMRKLLKESAEERKHLYPDEESAYRAMNEMEALLMKAESIPLQDVVDKYKDQTIDEVHHATERIISEFKAVALASNNKKCYQIPLRNKYYIERDDILSEIINCFGNGMSVIVLNGMGGSGKTSIAKEYAYKHKKEYSSIIWIDATNTKCILESGRKFLNQVMSNPNQYYSDEEVKGLMIWFLSNRDDWLLILDNADYLYDRTPEEKELTKELFEYLGSGEGHTLVTTRCMRDFEWAEIISVSVFDREQSMQYLVKRTHLKADIHADTLAGKLGDLPLALEYVSAYIVAQRISYKDYLKLWDDNGIEVFDNENYAEKTIQQAFYISLNRLCEGDKDRRETIMSFLYLCADLGQKYLPLQAYIDTANEDAQEMIAFIRGTIESGNKYAYFAGFDDSEDGVEKTYKYIKVLSDGTLIRRRIIDPENEDEFPDEIDPRYDFLRMLNNPIQRNELIRNICEYSIATWDGMIVTIHPLLSELLIKDMPDYKKADYYGKEHQYITMSKMYYKHGDAYLASKFAIDFLNEMINGIMFRLINCEEHNDYMAIMIKSVVKEIEDLITVFQQQFERKIVTSNNSELIMEAISLFKDFMEEVMLSDCIYPYAMEIRSYEKSFFTSISNMLGHNIIYRTFTTIEETELSGKEYYAQLAEVNEQEVIHIVLNTIVDEWIEISEKGKTRLTQLLQDDDTDWYILGLPKDMDTEGLKKLLEIK